MSSSSAESEDKSDIEERNVGTLEDEEASIRSKSPDPIEHPTAAKLFETDSEDDDDDDDEEEDNVDDHDGTRPSVNKSKAKKAASKVIQSGESGSDEDDDDDPSASARPRLMDDDDDSSQESPSTSKKSKKAPKIVEEDDEDDQPEQSLSKRVREDDEGNDDADDSDDDASSRNNEDEVDEDEEGDIKKKDDNAVDAEEEEEEDEDDEERKPARNTVYDFDIMMAKKKEENSRRRKRKNYDIINDNDDIIAEMINQMRDAVELDREANMNKQAATRKLKMLPFVVNQLRKVDLRDAFLDSDILSAINEWLTPLPDKSLPHLNIRESLLKILQDFHLYDVDRIRASGIGKAVMYLYKHPKETRENKIRAKELISSWSRPIFQLDSNFDAISREEREQRDLELMNKQNRVIKKTSDQKKTEEAPLKPGDKGWIPRARVPAPSTKDYVIRPASKVAEEAFRTRSRPSIVFKNKLPRRRYV